MVLAGLLVIAVGLWFMNTFGEWGDATPPSFEDVGDLLLVPAELPTAHTVSPVQFATGQGIAEYLVYDSTVESPDYTSYCITRSSESFDRARSLCAESGATVFNRDDLFVSISGPLASQLADATWTADFAEVEWSD